MSIPSNELISLPYQMGLTQKEFCQAFGINYVDFRKLRSGSSQMGVATFEKMRSELERIQVRLLSCKQEFVLETPANHEIQLELHLAQIKWKKSYHQCEAMMKRLKNYELGLGVLLRVDWCNSQKLTLVIEQQKARLTWLNAQIAKKEDSLLLLECVINRCQRKLKEAKK